MEETDREGGQAWDYGRSTGSENVQGNMLTILPWHFARFKLRSKETEDGEICRAKGSLF